VQRFRGAQESIRVRTTTVVPSMSLFCVIGTYTSALDGASGLTQAHPQPPDHPHRILLDSVGHLPHRILPGHSRRALASFTGNVCENRAQTHAFRAGMS
jgi:hypothetical protein